MRSTVLHRPLSSQIALTHKQLKNPLVLWNPCLLNAQQHPQNFSSKSNQKNMRKALPPRGTFPFKMCKPTTLGIWQKTFDCSADKQIHG